MRDICREKIKKLEDLPNVGKSIAEDLRKIGILTPYHLINQDPILMYKELCKITGKKHDLCLLDVFISVTEFMNGKEAKPWWTFTPKRKEIQEKIDIS